MLIIFILLHALPVCPGNNALAELSIREDSFTYDVVVFECYCSEHERVEADLKVRTNSLWSLVLSHMHDYQNPLYNHGTRHHVLLPLTSIRHIRLWDTYYCRWNPAMRNQVGARM